MSQPRPEDQLLQAVALENAKSILQARRRAEEELLTAQQALHAANLALQEESRVLELLNQVGQTLSSNLDLQDVVQVVTDLATELSGAKFGAFFYNTTDQSGESLLLYTLSGAPRAAFEQFGHPRATPLFGPTFHGQPPVRIDDVTTDPRYGQWGPHHGMPPGHLPVRSYLAVPVVSRSGEVLGGLFFGHPEAGVFTARSERLVVGISAQAAIAVDNARLYAEANRAAKERQALLESERLARLEAERASLMKDEFLATLSHELRTPLNAILGWAQIMLAGGRLPDDLRSGAETIARNARAQARLVDDLLDMSRIVSGKVRLDVQPTDLAAVAMAAVDAVRPSAEAKQIRLRTILDPGAVVSGDPDRLQQVIWNLLSNAVKFTPKSGAIDVLLQRVDSHVELVVRDSGTGISASFLPQVFDRFRQADDASTTRAQGGLGLGLAIVKQLVELHGGCVRAESAGVDQGASFVVTMPRMPIRGRESLEHLATTHQADSASADLRGVKVLVVDDENDTRELIRYILQGMHAEVLTASSADGGLELVKSEHPTLLISDIGMPGKDGYQFMRELRALPLAAGGGTPAIALTAFARTEDRTRAMRAGYQVHLAKPFEPQELVATIASVAAQLRTRQD